MKLVERYLSEVSQHLSAEGRNDIISELRNSLEEEIRDCAPEESATEANQSLVLERYGHPIKVAAEYSESQYLIGPELYPAFKQSFKTVFTITVALVVVIQLLQWITRGWISSPGSLLGNVFELGLWISFIVVASFVALERLGERLDWYEDWKASSLTSKIATNRSDLMTNLITEGVFLLWWNDAFKVLGELSGRLEWANIALSTTWEPLFWPVNIIVAVWFVLHFWVLLRDSWSVLALRVEIGLSVVALTIGVWLLTQNELLRFGSDVLNVSIAQTSMKVTLLVIMGLIVWDAWLAVRRLQNSS